MFRKTVILYCVSGISLLLVIIQFYNIRCIDRELKSVQAQQIGLEDYICNSFDVTWRDAESIAINTMIPFVDNYSLVVYLPSGLCRACFTTLLIACQEHEIDFNKVIVLSETEDLWIKSSCTSREIKYLTLNEEIEGLFDVYVSRLDHGVTPLVMRYNLERDYEFSLFMRK